MVVRKVQLEYCYQNKLFAPSDDILTLQRYELIPKLPNFQGIFIHHYPCMLIEWASINMPQTLYTSWFEACHVNRLIDFRKNGCTPKGWNVWGMCVESQNRFPTLQTLYTSAFWTICGEWGTQRSFDHQQIRWSPNSHCEVPRVHILLG